MRHIQRRLFFCLLISTGLFGQSSKRPFTGWAVLQGPTTTSDTVFAVLHDRGEDLKLCVGNLREPCKYLPKETTNKTHAQSKYVLSHFFFIDLPSQDIFKLKIEGKEGHSDIREFSLLKSGSALKFAVASCMDESFTELQEIMWKSLLDKKPEVLFMIGDNTYADKGLTPGSLASPDILWKRNVETREMLYLFRAPRLIPTFAIWDDHDFGVNDGDSTYPYKKESLEVFLSFFPQRENTLLKRGPGASSLLTLAGQDFFFLDDRFFRTKETHWGKEQEEWLFKNLQANKRPSWLINGDQFFGGYHKFESYEGRHSASFKNFLSRLRSTQKTIGFISGDRHLSEVMKIEKSEFGRESYELTSSGIHAAVYSGAWDKQKNPRQVAGISGTVNFMVIESSVNKGDLNVSLSSYGKERLLFDYKFTVKSTVGEQQQ